MQLPSLQNICIASPRPVTVAYSNRRDLIRFAGHVQSGVNYAKTIERRGEN